MAIFGGENVSKNQSLLGSKPNRFVKAASLLSVLAFASSLATAQTEVCECDKERPDGQTISQNSTAGESFENLALDFVMSLGSRIREQRNYYYYSSQNTQAGTVGPILGGAAGADDTVFGDSGFSLFVFDNYSRRDRDTTSTGGGYDQSVNTFTMGFDYRVNNATFVGMSLSSTEGESDFETIDAESDVSSVILGLHGARYWQNFFVSALISYGQMDIEIDRANTFDTFSADTDGRYWYGDLSLGYEHSLSNGLRITPVARVLYLGGEIDAYRESSNSGFGVVRSIDSEDLDNTLLTLSLQADYPFLMNWGVLMPTARLELVGNFSDGYETNGMALNAADDSTIATIAESTDDPDDTSLVFSAGFSAQLQQGLSGYVVYERLFEHDFMTKYSLVLGMRYEFP